MAFDRSFLNSVIPDNMHSFDVASSIAQYDKRGTLLSRGLKWLAHISDADSFAFLSPDAPDWTREPAPSHDWWPVSFQGLGYKNKGEYLTGEGWRLGEVCWYVTIQADTNTFIAADTIEHAVVRAVIFVDSYMKWRAIRPSERPDLEDVVRERMSRKGEGQ